MEKGGKYENGGDASSEGILIYFKWTTLPIWARGYKTQLSMKFLMLISVKISRNLAFFRLR